MAKKQPKLGRPPKRPEDTLDSSFLVLCKSSERTSWKAKAAARKMSVGNLIRQQMNKLK
jgi:hypothetical protein